MDGSRAMTVRDVALYLNVDEKTVYRLSKRRVLPGFKVAGTWRFKRGDIDAWIEERKKGSSTSNEGQAHAASSRIKARTKRRRAG